MSKALSSQGERTVSDCFVKVYTQLPGGNAWLQRHQGKRPLFACVLGFTETGLIPGISAAGATPHDRQYTAIADAEFLVNGVQPSPTFALPPLVAGASPVLISRSVAIAHQIPIYLFNAGLPQPPAVPAYDLGGKAASCLTTGKALPIAIVKHLFEQGLAWGTRLAEAVGNSYVILGECVVGGTTTALAVLTGLGIDAAGKVNSSHPNCNHQQKWEAVQRGLSHIPSWFSASPPKSSVSPLELVAAVGDPMQIVVAGMAIAASRQCGVLLAGGTQMLAVAALARALAHEEALPWQPEEVVVGTTRWVVEDPTGDTVGLADSVGNFSLLATPLSFAASRHRALQAYEQGFVKEGVGAGGCAIAAALYQGWGQMELLAAIDALADAYQQVSINDTHSLSTATEQ